MKSLNDLRAQHGWFTFPEREELAATIERIDERLKRLMPTSDLAGFKDRLIRAARLDLAGYALSDGDGYRRRVRSFYELPRAELAFVESWMLQADLSEELARLGWLPQPTPERIARLLKEDPDIPLRTRDKLLERYMPRDT
ncbi:MAG: hypothetical protein IAE85_12050 [Anaerolinea sp.]|nr:hypothetical protein [Anaerolinea sp.]